MLALFPAFHNSQLQGASCARSISSLPQFSIVEASQILIFIEYNLYSIHYIAKQNQLDSC